MNFKNFIFSHQVQLMQLTNKKFGYRKETVRLMHNIEIRLLHYSHIVKLLLL